MFNFNFDLMKERWDGGKRALNMLRLVLMEILNHFKVRWFQDSLKS